MLVDTSVWIDHFRRSDPALSDALDRGDVQCHDFVIGELACPGGHLLHVEPIVCSDEPAGADKPIANFHVDWSSTGYGWADRLRRFGYYIDYVRNAVWEV